MSTHRRQYDGLGAPPPAGAGPGADPATAALRDHLVRSRLAGHVATSPRSVLDNAGKVVAGDSDYTFGLSDHRDTAVAEVLEAVRAVCGGDPRGAEDPDGPGWIAPEAALAGIAVHRERLAAVAAGGGARVLLATGHPTGLLGHYAELARSLQRRGSRLLAPLDDVFVGERRGRRVGIRFVDGVACAFNGASLLHTHRSAYMEAMLDAVGGGPGTVELVVADHGMAGAAIERGIPTLSIADVNDPALPLAQVRGRTDAVLPIDDNLAPRLFVPVTLAVLAGL